MRAATPLIYFRCVNDEHQEPSLTLKDTFTVHVGRWAYCPRDVRATDHRWEETSGVSVSQITGRARPE